MSQAAIDVARRIPDIVTIPDPWPHGILDDFLPQPIFDELIESLPLLPWSTKSQKARKCKTLPASVTSLLSDEVVLDAIRAANGFTRGKPSIEVVYRTVPLAPHVDRKDKRWNGQIYLAGDPKGTEFYDAAGNLACVGEWKPNRLTCWTIPPNKEKHAAPKSQGRYVLLWWILGE